MSDAAEFDFETAELPAVPQEAPEELGSFAEVMGAGEVYDSATLSGDVYHRLSAEDKAQLVGVPFIIEDHKLIEGANGWFAVLFVVTQKNERYSFSDGGYDITPKLENVRRGTKILAKHGLRMKPNEQGRPTFLLT